MSEKDRRIYVMIPLEREPKHDDDDDMARYYFYHYYPRYNDELCRMIRNASPAILFSIIIITPYPSSHNC
jgi:hypothetical protein